MARSRVELFEQIRKDSRAGGSSIRQLAGKHHVHRRTVRQALESAVPLPRKGYPQRHRPAIDAYAAVIDSWLVADRDAPYAAGLAAAGRGARRDVLGGDGVAVCGPPPG